MTSLDFALSVRQPWAWAIIFAGKDIENRSWQAVNHGLNQRRPSGCNRKLCLDRRRSNQRKRL